MSDTTLIEWRALYRAAISFRDLAPWRWMVDADLFGVQNPEDGTIGYCCVLGNLGEQFGLVVYLGDDGLRSYRRLQAGELWPPDAGVLLTQHCLLASFEDRGVLERRDRELIKSVGLRVRGRNAWPQFRTFTPGYWPWYVTPPEARFLTIALEQSCVVAEHQATADPLRELDENGRILLRSNQQGIWRNRWTTTTLREPLPPQLGPLDTDRIDRIRHGAKLRGGTWESDRFYAPSPVQNDRAERPYFAVVGLTVDRATRLVFPPLLVEPDTWPTAYQDYQLELLEQAERMPRAIAVRDATLKHVLEPLTTALGIQLRLVGRLPQLDAARDILVQVLSRL